MMKTIDKIMAKGKTGLVLLASLFALGCTEMIKDSPIGWYHRAKEEIKAEVGNENQREEDNIQITTPQGYKIRLSENSHVYYQGKECTIWNITPPYLDISFPESEGGTIYHSKDKFRIKITDLDMFNE